MCLRLTMEPARAKWHGWRIHMLPTTQVKSMRSVALPENPSRKAEFVEDAKRPVEAFISEHVKHARSKKTWRRLDYNRASLGKGSLFKVWEMSDITAQNSFRRRARFLSALLNMKEPYTTKKAWIWK